MNLLRTLGYCFLFVMVPLGGLLAAYPDAIAAGLSDMLGTSVSRGNLGIAFLFVTAACMRIDLSIRRCAQSRPASLA